MIRYEKHYYGGDWQTPSTSDTIDVVSSATEEIIGRVPRGIGGGCRSRCQGGARRLRALVADER